MLLTVVLGGCASPKTDVPNAERLSGCFARIDHVVMEAGWKPLRTAVLPARALEIRVWSVPALSAVDGIAFRRDGAVWIGRRVTESPQKRATPRVRVVNPKSGWQEFWAKAEPLGILTLPDSSTLGEEDLFYDGSTTVVEVRRGNKYRSYHYYLASQQRWPEARQMTKIEELISEEFR